MGSLPEAGACIIVQQLRVVKGLGSCLLAIQAEGEKLSENSYKSRKPSPKYADYRSVESYIMNLAREGVQSCVVATGILYGGGEDMLHSIFKVEACFTPMQSWRCR